MAILTFAYSDFWGPDSSWVLNHSSNLALRSRYTAFQLYVLVLSHIHRHLLNNPIIVLVIAISCSS